MEVPAVAIEALKQTPIAVALVWVISIFSKKDDESKQKMYEMQSRMLEAFDKNTVATTRLESTVIEHRKSSEAFTQAVTEALRRTK